VAADAPRQVANAHTIFNVINAFLFIGFAPQIARLVERLVPDRSLSAQPVLEPRFLDDNLLGTPAMALQNVRYEIGRMGEYVHDMLLQSLPAALGNNRRALERLAALDRPLDRLHRAVITYLGRISLTSLSPEQAGHLMQLVQIANDLEHIADRVAADIVTSTRKRLDERATIRPGAVAHIRAYHAEVAKALAGALEAVMKEDRKLAASVRRMKREVSEIARELETEGFQNLPAESKSGVLGYVREVELLEIYDGIFKISRRIARTQLKNGGRSNAAD
jgi:phosphate:Na+ symporter